MTKTDLKNLLIGILLLVVAGFAAYFVVRWITTVFSSVDKAVQAAVVAGLVVTFSSLFTFWKERSRSIKEAHRDKKIEVYSRFFELMFEIIKATKTADEFDEIALAEKLMEVSRGVLFYGSPKVVLNYSEISKTSGDSDIAPEIVLRRIGRVLLAMRGDIGLSNRGLDELTIHQLYITEDLRRLGKDL